MLKIRAWEDNEEKIIPISNITGTVKKDRLIVDIDQPLLLNPVIILPYTPQTYGELVHVNGLLMAEGSNCDYTISGNVITFNVGILPKAGHVQINYTYE